MAVATDRVGQQRPRHITLRVTPKQANEIGRFAKGDGSVSAYIRRLIEDDIRRRTA